jgi:hypothetical protein
MHPMAIFVHGRKWKKKEKKNVNSLSMLASPVHADVPCDQSLDLEVRAYSIPVMKGMKT